MTLKISFVLIGEGSFDDALRIPLEELCRLCGAQQIESILPDYDRLPNRVGHTVEGKVRAALALEPNVNLLFIHRDADAPDPTPRYEEIAEAIGALDAIPPHVAVVPVQETEAWLLLDESEIRWVAQNPNGRVPLSLPTPGQVEAIANPKERLEETLIRACNLRGRKLKRFTRDLAKHKRRLLERLDPEGPVTQVPAWQQLRQDITEVLELIRTAEQEHDDAEQ